MGGLLGVKKPEPMAPPPVPPPPAVPDVGPEVGEVARRRRPRGRKETFLTGELVPMDLGKKRLFG